MRSTLWDDSPINFSKHCLLTSCPRKEYVLLPCAFWTISPLELEAIYNTMSCSRLLHSSNVSRKLFRSESWNWPKQLPAAHLHLELKSWCSLSCTGFVNLNVCCQGFWKQEHHMQNHREQSVLTELAMCPRCFVEPLCVLMFLSTVLLLLQQPPGWYCCRLSFSHSPVKTFAESQCLQVFPSGMCWGLRMTTQPLLCDSQQHHPHHCLPDMLILNHQTSIARFALSSLKNHVPSQLKMQDRSL